MVRSPRAGMSRRHTVIDGDRGRPFPACGDEPEALKAILQRIQSVPRVRG